MKRVNKKALAFFALLLIALVGYLGYTAWRSGAGATGVVGTGDMGNQYRVQAVIVRSESRTDEEGVTSVIYHADEGGIVYKGNQIAEVYSTGYSQTDMNKLLNARADIKAYLNTLLKTAYADVQLDRMDSQLYAAVDGLYDIIHGRGAGNVLNLSEQMHIIMKNRIGYLKGRYVNDQSLTALFETESSYEKKIAGWTKTYLADRDCLVSFYTDGYENVFDLSTIDDVTIAQVKSVLAGIAPPQSPSEKGKTAVFKEVWNDGWYLLAVSNDRNWNPVIGQNYKIAIEGFEDTDFSAVVTSFTRSGSEMLVRMFVNSDVRPVMNLRTASAVVGEMYVSGMKVPVRALTQQDGQAGIVLTDQGGIFLPVTVIMQDNEYAIIQSDFPGALREGQRIRLF